MRHLQLSKHLFRNQNTVPVVKSAQLSLGAASHTLLVRRLQLSLLRSVAPKVTFAAESGREAIYPMKRYSKTQSPAVLSLIQTVAKQLADNNIVQLRQPTTNSNAYRLRLTRCSLTDSMRQLNERLPDFDFDPFTLNSQIELTPAAGPKHEAILRLSGLPLRIGRTIK